MPHTVLSVDADDAVRSARNEVLRQAGFHVIDAVSGPDALKLASEEQPTLVVLAVGSPGTDDFALSKRLKADPRTTLIPVLHISSQGESYHDYPESLESGADAYLQEPVEPRVLIAVVTALIRARSGAERNAFAKDRLSALIDSIPDEVWLADAQGRFTLANPSACREFKIGALTLFEVEKFARSLEVYRADGSPRPLEEAPPLRALRGETVRNQEETVRTPVHGELRFRQVSASPVRDATGNIVGSVSVVRDITDLKRAEQSLRASERQYRTLFETMTEGFALYEIVCDEAGKLCDLRFLAVNPAFERQTGLKAEGVLGRTLLELFPGAERVWAERYGQVALTGQAARFEERFGPLGRWYEVSAFRPEPGRLGVVFTDTTERKRAEEERQRLAGDLADRVGELQAILDAAPVAIWIAHDPQCLRITGNAYADHIVMQTERGGNISRSARPGDEAVSYKAFRKGVELRPEELPAQIAAATGQPANQEEVDLVFPDGRTVHTLLGAVPLFDAQGRVRGSVAAGVDVTRRKRAEEALRESEAVLRTLFDSPGVMRGIVELIDGALVHVSCNAAAAKMYGVDRDSISGKSATELGTPEEVARSWVGLYEELRRTGKPVSMEYARRDADGKGRWLLTTASYLGTGRSGNPRFGYTILDLSERKQAELTLRRSEERYRTIVDTANEGIWTVDADVTTTFVNARMAEMLGYSPQEMMGMSAFAFMDEEGIALAKQRLETRVQGIKGSYEHKYFRKDRTPIWTLSSVTPLKDSQGKFAGSVGMLTDITERKKVEQELRIAHDRLEIAQQASGSGTWDWDIATNHLEWSPRLFELFGLSPATTASSFAGWTNAVHPEDRALAAARIEEALRNHTPLDSEYRVIHPDGQVRWISATGKGVYSEQNQPIRMAGLCVDITDRKRAEEELRQSEERYRMLFSGLIEGFCIIEVIFDADAKPIDYRFLEINPAFEAQTGLENAKGRLVRELAPDLEAHWFEIYGQVALTGQPARFVNEAKALHRWYDVSAYRVGGPESRRVAILFNDVTESRRAEEALRDSEKMYRAIGETIDYGVWVCAPDGRNTYASDSFLKLVGLTQEQCSSFGWGDVLHPEDAERTVAAWKECVRTEGRWDIEHRFRGVDGEWHPILARGVPVRDEQGRITRWAGINLDISALKRTEESLRESESRERARAAELEALMDAAPAAIFVAHDAECQQMTGNRMVYSLLRRQPGSNLSKSAPESERPTNFRTMKDGVEIPPQELPIQRAVSTGQPVRDCELELVFDDGATVYLLGDAVPTLDAEGHSRGAVGVFVDITERKSAERSLREAQKLESLGLLAGGVAHDFNNLLVGVIGNASLAQEMLPPDHPAAELVNRVLKTGEQAAHLTRQMLAYSGKGRFLVEALSLSELIPDMTGLVRPSIPKKIALRLDLEDDLPPVEADRGQIQQVFMNLALNAAEAIGSREGAIVVKTGVENVDAQYARQHPEAAQIQPGKYVYLEVRDNGCGMSEATRARIFDPFFTTKFTGRGLGLAAVAGIVRGHKGMIAVHSAPGQGSCFTVLFPAAERAAGQPAVGARRVALQGQGAILVVDDEPLVREMAKHALERRGYTVLLAANGPAAIDILKRHPGDIALVVLDMSMPQMSGEETLPELRKLRPGVKVVVSSGYSEAEAMSPFRGQAVSGFLQKPYTSMGLAEKVKAAIG